jgi:hypothetical protein
MGKATVVVSGGFAGSVGCVEKDQSPALLRIGWSRDTSPQNGCCRALESCCRVAGENKRVPCFATLEGAGAALCSARKLLQVNLLMVPKLGSRRESSLCRSESRTGTCTWHQVFGVGSAELKAWCFLLPYGHLLPAFSWTPTFLSWLRGVVKISDARLLTVRDLSAANLRNVLTNVL